MDLSRTHTAHHEPRPNAAGAARGGILLATTSTAANLSCCRATRCIRNLSRRSAMMAPAIHVEDSRRILFYLASLSTRESRRGLRSRALKIFQSNRINRFGDEIINPINRPRRNRGRLRKIFRATDTSSSSIFMNHRLIRALNPTI